MDLGCAWWRWCTIRSALETGLAPERGRGAGGQRAHGAGRHARRGGDQPRHGGSDSPTTASAASRIAVVEPGIDRRRLTAETRAPNATADVELLCVASLVPRKGHAVLLEALARLRHLPWRLTCVGSPDLDPDAAARVLRQRSTSWASPAASRSPARRSGADLDGAYERADAFVLADLLRGLRPGRGRGGGARAAGGVLGHRRRRGAGRRRFRRDRASGRGRGADRGAGASHRRRRCNARSWPAARRPGRPPSGRGRKPRPFSRRRCWSACRGELQR